MIRVAGGQALVDHSEERATAPSRFPIAPLGAAAYSCLLTGRQDARQDALLLALPPFLPLCSRRCYRTSRAA